MLTRTVNQPSPADSPWGTIATKVQPLPDVPIYLINTPANEGGYMVESEWAVENLTRAARIYGQTHHDDDIYWFCYGKDCEWLILMWDYPPLCDRGIRGLDISTEKATDDLEKMIKIHLPRFLLSYRKDFKESADVV